MSGEDPLTPPGAAEWRAPVMERQSEVPAVDSEWEEAKKRFDELAAEEGENLGKLADIARTHGAENFQDLVRLLEENKKQFSEEELEAIGPVVEKLKRVLFDRMKIEFINVGPLRSQPSVEERKRFDDLHGKLKIFLTQRGMTRAEEYVRRIQAKDSDESIEAVKEFAFLLQGIENIIARENSEPSHYRVSAERIPTVEEVRAERIKNFLFELACDLQEICCTGWAGLDGETQASVEGMIKNIEKDALEHEETKRAWQRVQEYVREDVIREALESSMNATDEDEFTGGVTPLELSELKKAI